MKFIELVKVMENMIILPTDKYRFPLNKNMETQTWSYDDESPEYDDDEVYEGEVLKLTTAKNISDVNPKNADKLYAVLDLE